jgi:hypothetical protein
LGRFLDVVGLCHETCSQLSEAVSIKQLMFC